MRRILAASAALLTAITLSSCAGSPLHEEDEGFDCRTMGNRTCGVVTDGIHYAVQYDADGVVVAVEVIPS